MLNKYKDVLRVPDGAQVVNIRHRHFSTIRNGDMIAVCNAVEYLRKDHPDLRFHITDEAMHGADYCFKFRKFLIDNSDYLSAEPGETDLMFRSDYHPATPYMVSLWHYRGSVGEHVSLKIDRQREKKIAVFPVFDAGYNTYRNWSLALTQEIVNRFSDPEFDDYQKVFCSLYGAHGLDYRGFTRSEDFLTNVEHIATCSHYVGGDTGMSHFAGALEDGPKLFFYLHVEGRFHTAPFHAGRKGEWNLYD